MSGSTARRRPPQRRHRRAGPFRIAEGHRRRRAAPGPDRRPRGRDPCVQPRDGRAGARCCGSGRCRSGGRTAGRSARRCADRVEGQHVHPRGAHHVFVEDPRGLAASVRRDRGHQAGRRRSRRDRQDQPRRVRHGVEHREQRVRPHPEPPRHQPGAGRVERWQRSGGRRRVRRSEPRQRHGRLDPPARCTVRRGRA